MWLSTVRFHCINSSQSIAWPMTVRVLRFLRLREASIKTGLGACMWNHHTNPHARLARELLRWSDPAVETVSLSREAGDQGLTGRSACNNYLSFQFTVSLTPSITAHPAWLRRESEQVQRPLRTLRSLDGWALSLKAPSHESGPPPFPGSNARQAITQRQ